MSPPLGGAGGVSRYRNLLLKNCPRQFCLESLGDTAEGPVLRQPKLVRAGVQGRSTDE
jgi:hypothetical protein